MSFSFVYITLLLKPKKASRVSEKERCKLNDLALYFGCDMLTINFHDSSDRVAVGRALDLPVYFGDAGSREVTKTIKI